MKNTLLLSGVQSRTGCMALLIAFSIFFMTWSEGGIGAAESNGADHGRKLILEVINRHFTMGKKIPSAYLRVFSDGTAECHTEKFTGKEKNLTKTKVLGAGEFEQLKEVISDPEMLDVEKRYERMHFVVDSWMEWDIKVQHQGGVQRIQVASFSPTSARERNQPYPNALVRLGCSILKIRNGVYGDVDIRSISDCPNIHLIH